MLFRSHKDLLEEFTYFLPDAQAPAQASHPLHAIHLPMAQLLVPLPALAAILCLNAGQ